MTYLAFQDGMYLIRKSTKNPAQPYTLQIYYGGQDFNLPVKKVQDGYSIGAGNRVRMYKHC